MWPGYYNSMVTPFKKILLAASYQISGKNEKSQSVYYSSAGFQTFLPSGFTLWNHLERFLIHLHRIQGMLHRLIWQPASPLYSVDLKLW